MTSPDPYTSSAPLALLLLLLLPPLLSHLVLCQVDDADRVLSVQFDWKGQRKPLTTLLIGTSPEFELALYTLCFVAGEGGGRALVAPAAACCCMRCGECCRQQCCMALPEVCLKPGQRTLQKWLWVPVRLMPSRA
jgi:hypothetical protein